jgi:hypothetical protein
MDLKLLKPKKLQMVVCEKERLFINPAMAYRKNA